MVEYIWNGFDARATEVRIRYQYNELESLTNFEISDNGDGIDFTQLKVKFEPFFESEKVLEPIRGKNISTIHGKKGVGRLTFFKYAHIAHWETTYIHKKVLKSGTITISSDKLNDYIPKTVEHIFGNQTGTTVKFSNLIISKNDIDFKIIPYIVREFCWFLELNKNRGVQIYINDTPLDYSENIVDFDDQLTITPEKSNVSFSVKYIQWRESLLKEHSKFYFINNENQEVYKDYTTLNRKADQFYHSVYIQSKFFDGFNFKAPENNPQAALFSSAKSAYEYKYLINELNKYLKDKRKPYLQECASWLIVGYEEEGILPEYENEWERRFKKTELVESIKALYEVQPKLFTNLNIDQKKNFVRLLDLLLNSNEKEHIFTIIEGVADLEPEERQDLAEIFKVTRLNRVLNTVKLIKDRYEVYYKLKDLVFRPDLKANEVDHLQKLIEKHYWIFGEQYNLVCSAEVKFEGALRRYTYLLTEKDSSPEIDHPDKLKEMDIFACRQNVLTDRIENIVVELKHPLIRLGSEQHTQINKYLNVILQQPEFNAPNMYWEFHLVGNKFDTSNFLQQQIVTNRPHGQRSLILNLEDGRVKVFAKTWSEVFAEFEIKHKYLDKQLQLERDKLLNSELTAEDTIRAVDNNLAIQSEAVEVKGKDL